MTKQKQLILSIINQSMQHFTVEQIFAEAKKVLPGIALGTIYNNLNALLKEKQIRKLSLPGQIDRYDKISPLHDHLICSECGKISDVMLPDLSETIQNSLGISIASYTLNIDYICDNCKKRKGHHL